VALLGIIPMGAFVEPDDKQLATKTTIEKIRVYIAGSGANFTAMLFFFIIFLMIQPYILSQSEYDYVYYGELEDYFGQEIALIDNTPISEIDFKTFEYSSGDKFNITTNNKDKFTAIVDENDNLGIIKRMNITNPLAKFVFNLIALLVCLNFFVAAFNLLPVSILDGYQILLQVLGDKRTRYISYILIIALIAQFIPWLWK
jgi:membrane-associated protease RseP (regulator of RpoE activity)